MYHMPNGKGIHIISDATDEKSQLFVTSLDDVELLSAWKPVTNSAILFRIMGHTFLIRNDTIAGGRHQLTDYVVPTTVGRRVEKAMKRNRITYKLLRTLDSMHANVTKRTALGKLFARPELQVILDASRALGEAGIRGFENPAAMNFYGIAMQLFKLRNREHDAPTEPSVRTQEEVSESVEKRREKRQSRRLCRNQIPHRSWFTPRSWYTCSRCPSGSQCTGMCGNTCSSCWAWLCGDCCWYRGCHDHDVCCNIHGFWSSHCLLPFSFSCHSPYSC